MCCVGGRGELDNTAGWLHFKLTINIEEYLTLPGRTTVFPRKSTFPLSELTSPYLFSLLSPEIHLFSYLCHTQLKIYFIPLREKFPTKPTLLLSY